MLNWISRFNIFCFLHDQCIAGAGVLDQVALQERSCREDQQDWIFLHLGYGLKADTMGVKGGPGDPIGFPDAFLFIPKYVLLLEGDMVSIGSVEQDHEQVFHEILVGSQGAGRISRVSPLRGKVTREEYLSTVKNLQQHILRGDCYEINFCQEFYAEDVEVDPLQVYQRLTTVSPNPFAAFYRHHDKYLMCASPERFIRKQGNRIISQPIKGTIRRGGEAEGEDEALRKALYESQKERSENVMVVDLVRNDLSMICKEGSVRVDELFGIYPFPQVHQMISTISGELREGTSFLDIIRACFPMGSMTGAPKKRVLELIDQYESTGRGLFSGSIGYMKPGGDFDLNVVIRSIFYNESKRYLNYLVGSGITHYSDPEKEYEECLLKSGAMQQALDISSQGAGGSSH